MKRKHNRLLIMLLIVAMAVCMMPGAGLFTGAEAVYADVVHISGEVNTSDLALGGEYFLDGDTIITIDSSIIISSIDVSASNLTIKEGDVLDPENDPDPIFSIYGKGITGYSGSVYLESGHLDIDIENNNDVYPTAIDLPNGGFKMKGGGLFINMYSTSASASVVYGIRSKSFGMTDGSANITCVANARGSAYGVSTNDFDMKGGSLGIDAKANASGFAASGVVAQGSTSDSNFNMDGGQLTTTGWATSADSYGINWTADKSKNYFSVYGGKITAQGQNRGLCSWAPITIDGAEINAKATGDSGIAIANATGAEIGVYGANTKIIADAPLGYAMVAYSAKINLAAYINIVSPAGGSVGSCWSNANAILDSSSNVAKYAELQAGETIPTNIAITYDASKAFPTTRLTGHEVTLHLLRNVTSNPGNANAHDGWYVFSADPDKTDTKTYDYTCLVKKDGSSYVPLNDSDVLLNTTDEYYFKFNIEEDGTRPFDPALTYTATVNGQPADDVWQPTSGGDQLYVYKRVYLDESNDVIWSIDVTPKDAKVEPDGFRQFEYTTVAATSDEVNWTVTGGSYSGTYINDAGNLHVGAGESVGTELKVRATSKVDSAIYNEVSVEVVEEAPYIESVTLSCDKTEVYVGTGVTIYAEVVGTGSHELTWELMGSDGSSYFSSGSDDYRYLLVGQDETATKLTVKATSKENPNISDTWDLTVLPKNIITGPINITYDESAVVLNDSKNGKQATEEFLAAITSPLGSGLGIEDAPGGWYVFGSETYTSLAYWNSSYHMFDKLYDSLDNLRPDREYYLCFNIEDCSSTHCFDYDAGLDCLNITVNGHRVNGNTVIAQWGGKINVYVRVYFEGQEPTESPLERIYGKTRFDTAFEAADWLKTMKALDKFPSIVIASGMDFPDALAGAYLAEVKNAPVLLASEGTAPKVAEYVKENMDAGGAVYILGGKGAVPEVMVDELKAQGISEEQIHRLAGKNRYETNILILQEAGVSGQDLLICSGSGYADSLSASAVGKPIFLVGSSLNDAQKEYLDSVKGQLSGNFYAIGGKGAVSEEVFAEVQSYGTGTFERVSGSNRFLTSVAIAEKFFVPDQIDDVVLAYAMNYPDGLAGGPVAYATKSPLLLVNNTNYTDAMNYVTHTYAMKVRVMGGASLISDEVALEVLNL